MTTEQQTNYSKTGSVKTRYLALLLPVLLAVYLLITSTIHLSDTLWQYDAKRMLQLYLLPLMFLWALLIPSLRRAFADQLSRIPRWMGWALTLMFGLGVVSAWYNSTSSMGLAYSLADVALLFLLIPAALSIAACRTLAGELFDHLILIMVAMLGVAVGMQELLGVLAAFNSGVQFNPQIALPNFSWPRFYNQVQSWTIPAIAALPLLFPRKPLVWVLCLLSLGLNWYVVLATGGRGTALAVAVAVLIATAVWPAIRKQWLFTHVAGVLLGALIYTLVVIGHSQIIHPDADLANIEKNQQSGQTLDSPETGKFTSTLQGERMSSSSGRTRMWRGSLNDTKSHPWLGIGPMNYACKGPIYRAAHPHSFPMQFVSEWGVPAFLLLLAIGLFLAFKLVQTIRKPSENAAASSYLQVALATGLVAAAIHACLSGVLIMPASQVAGILIGGWLLGSLLGSQAHVNLGPRSFRPAPSIVLVFSLIISIVFLWFAKSEIQMHEQRLKETPTMDQLIPRLWQNGKVCRLYQIPLDQSNPEE